MNPQQLYNEVCLECAQHITRRYSTSFSMGIRLFEEKLRDPIYAIYGFVRFADEIVDTFHDHDKELLLREFRDETYKAIERKLSLNPVLHAFQQTVREYNIETELIDAFLYSMELDIESRTFERGLYDTYIYGSAEVVGLMCLRVFTAEKPEGYDRLKEPAKRLGAAFQKINFLRDISSDYYDRGRVYFPGVEFTTFSEDQKREIEEEIAADFDAALVGIRSLPRGSRLGVHCAYVYFKNLLRRIQATEVKRIANERIRVPNSAKLGLMLSSAVRHKLNAL